MARYTAITPDYQPMSMEELLRVPTMLVKDTESQLDKFEAQEDKMAVLEAMAGDNAEIRNYLNNYYTTRDEAANIIAGMQTNNVYDTRLADVNRKLTRAYREGPLKAISGIEAYSKAMKSKPDDDIMGEYKMMDFINNPNFNPKSISSKNVTNEAAVISTALAKDKPIEVTTSADGTYMTQTSGFKNSDIEDAMRLNSNTALGKAVAELRNKYNYDGMSDAEKARFDLSLKTGLIQGIGGEKIQKVAQGKGGRGRSSSGGSGSGSSSSSSSSTSSSTSTNVARGWGND